MRDAIKESLSARIFVMILNWKLARAMGRKFSTRSASGDFGIKIKISEFRFGGSLPVTKTIEQHRSHQKPLYPRSVDKSAPPQPSGPGAPSPFMSNIAVLISASVGTEVRE
jgi:hypothetical protein